MASTDGTTPKKNTIRKKLVKRRPPEKGSIQALAEFHEKLAIAARLYNQKVDEGRAGAFKAIIAALDYFIARGIPYDDLAPLEAVVSALHDADKGIASPIFKPDTKSGRPPKPTDTQEMESYMVVIMELCILHQKNLGAHPYLEPAAKQAAKLINDSNWPKKIKHQHLKKLRDWLLEGPSKSVGNNIVSEMMRSKFATSQPLEFAKTLLSMPTFNPPGNLNSSD
jgi:hypothetical protein